MKQFLLSFTMLASCAAGALAAQATFSKDGNSVFYSPLEGASLVQAHLNPFREETIDLEKFVGDQDVYEVSLRTSDGAILFGTRTQIWAYHPNSKKAEKLAEAPRGVLLDDIAYDPSTEGVIVTALYQSEPHTPFDHPSLWWLGKGSRDFTQIVLNRVGQLEGLAVTQSGEVFFGCEGDLWHGVVAADEDAVAAGHAGSLVAYRYAPMASRETFPGPPTQVGVRNVAIAGSKIYAHIRRLGDTGWGSIVRVNAPKGVDPNEACGDTLDRRLETYREALASAELVMKSNHRGRLCASADGHRVFFTVENEPFLVENDGPAKSLAPAQEETKATPTPTPTQHNLDSWVNPTPTPKPSPTPKTKATPTPKPKFRVFQPVLQ